VSEINLCLNRLKGREEGDKQYAYNDATGKRVTCKPGGNLSIGIGVNLENGLDEEEREWITQHRLLIFSTELCALVWYEKLDTVRRSVILDIAFNEGYLGLLRFHLMIAAIEKGDWVEAQAQCHVEDQRLDAQRYIPLGKILLTGVDQ
jgi:lysozyme